MEQDDKGPWPWIGILATGFIILAVISTLRPSSIEHVQGTLVNVELEDTSGVMWTGMFPMPFTETTARFNIYGTNGLRHFEYQMSGKSFDEILWRDGQSVLVSIRHGWLGADTIQYVEVEGVRY